MERDGNGGGGAVYTLDVTRMFGVEYIGLFNDMARFVMIQVAVQFMLVTMDPAKYSLFSADFMILLLFVVVGVLAYCWTWIAAMLMGAQWNSALLLDADVRSATVAMDRADAIVHTGLEAAAVRHVVCGTDAVVATACKLGDNVLRDLEVFEEYGTTSTDERATLFAAVDRTRLQGSGAYLKALLGCPVSEVAVLRGRQAYVEACMGHVRDASVCEHFEGMRETEADVLWMFERHSEELDALYEMLYFNMWLTRPLNGQGPVLTAYTLYRVLASPVIGMVAPLTYFVVPYLIVRWKVRLRISFASYMRICFAMLTSRAGPLGAAGGLRWLSMTFTAIMYFYGILNSIQVSKTLHRITSMIVRRMDSVAKFVHHARQADEACWSDAGMACFFQTCPPCADHVAVADLLAIGIGRGGSKAMLLRHFGAHLRAFKAFKDQAYVPLYQRAYMLDAVMSVARLASEGRTCMCAFEEAAAPRLRLRAFYHPCIDPQRVVCNDLTLGGGAAAASAIITGPNAGGKSTMVKAAVACVLLAQTLTVAYARVCALTPLAFINTQVNIPDCKGRESLFEAEMLRSRDNINAVARTTGHSLVAMDEIFNSTNAVEGVAGAYAIVRRLGACPTALTLLTTHYGYLTKLAKEDPGRFAAYKMDVRQQGPVITYPYKLSKGVSKQYIALELLAMHGFDAELVEDALRVKRAILSPAAELHKTIPVDIAVEEEPKEGAERCCP